MRIVNRVAAAERIWRLPGLRLVAALAAFAAVTVVTALIAHPRILIGFQAYDDEGYMLIALKEFLRHGHLYNDVFSQYGPFYYEFWGAVFEIFGLGVNHDGGRAAVAVAWVLTSLLFGLSIWRLTRSALLGLATQMLVFGAIVTVVNEPMHPGSLICLLLGVIVAISALVRARFSPLAIGLLGGAVMALILVKINVGAFAFISLALACVVSYPALCTRRWLRPALEVLFVAVPLLLMTSKFGEAWARHYAVHVALAALALVIALRARTGLPRRSDEELRWLLGGFIVVGVVVCVAILAAGTTPGGLIDGVIGQPLRQSDAFSLALGLSNRIYIFDFLALLGAGGYWYMRRGGSRPSSPALNSAIALLSLLIGLEMALSVVGKTVLFNVSLFSGYQFGLLSFAWVALVPVAGAEDRETSFARLFVPLLAVLQALHAFPVAGSQVAWSTFLLVPVGALCVANGARGLARELTGERERRAFGAIAVVATAILMVVLVNVQLRQPLNEARAVYDSSVSLELPGATDVRLPETEVRRYREVTAAINRYCRSFVMLPGMNSFYIWTRQEPPTGSNATGWMTLFDESHQRRVIGETRSIRDLCLLRNIPQAEGWSAGPIPQGPLVRYLEHGFKPIAGFEGNYELLRREGPARVEP